LFIIGIKIIKIWSKEGKWDWNHLIGKNKVEIMLLGSTLWKVKINRLIKWFYLPIKIKTTKIIMVKHPKEQLG
jgi:hypothetical protein